MEKLKKSNFNEAYFELNNWSKIRQFSQFQILGHVAALHFPHYHHGTPCKMRKQMRRKEAANFFSYCAMFYATPALHGKYKA